MSNYDFLRASNGSGDAALMHVTADRLTGSATLLVDGLVNVPAKFIATSGTLNASGFITPSSKREFRGHTNSGTIVIDAFEPGSVDDGHTAGQVVTIRPATGWADRVAAFIESLTGFGTPDAATKTGLATAVLPSVYPVGSVFISTVSTNPATLFGFGTWVAYAAGRTIIGVGTSDQAFAAAATGGESNHTLSIAEMPSHTHDLYGSSINVGSVPDNGNWQLNYNRPFEMPNWLGSGAMAARGGDGAHNNLPPYIVTYMWKRTA